VNREQIYKSRQLAGRVRRYHTWSVLHQQTVGEHSARVACILVEIFGMPRAEVLYYALHHDSGELWTGDAPFGIKKTNQQFSEQYEAEEIYGRKMLEVEMPELTDEEKMQVKIADLLEMWEFGIVEVMMGNQFCKMVATDTLSAALNLADEHNFYDLVYDWHSKQEFNQ